MKKPTIKKQTNEDWKKVMADSSTEIVNSIDQLIKFLKKNKKIINKDVKTFGSKASGVNEMFETLTITLDLKINELWDIIDEN